MKTYASLFTGGGLADWGARAAGLTPVWGVELDAQIAAVAQQNDPSGTIYAASVLDVDYSALTRVDVLHASPPCPNFSVAKTGGVETPLDLALADAVCRAIRAQAPTLFTLENVRGYQGSQSLARIQATLLDLDYHVTTVIVNAADYGVPQTRERLFLIAHAGGWMQSQRPLPSKQPWKGWYQAIEDLIPTLPESAFAPWQEERLKAAGMDMSFLIQNNDSEYGLPYRSGDEPVHAITTQTGGRARAFILDGQNAGRDITMRAEAEHRFSLSAGAKGDPRAFLMGDGDTWRPVRSESEPSPTLSAHNGARAFLVDGSGNEFRSADSTVTVRDEGEPSITIRAAVPSPLPRAWLASGRVVAMTPRALGRFQTLPDTYQLPDKKSLACRIIGNGVAVDAYAALLRSQLCS